MHFLKHINLLWKKSENTKKNFLHFAKSVSLEKKLNCKPPEKKCLIFGMTFIVHVYKTTGYLANFA